MGEEYEYSVEDCGCGAGSNSANRALANVWRVKKITKRNGRAVNTTFVTGKTNKATALAELAKLKGGTN